MITHTKNSDNSSDAQNIISKFLDKNSSFAFSL